MDISLTEVIPLGGSVVLMTLLLKMWAAERVRWIREHDRLLDEFHEDRKALLAEHAAELARHDELCEKRIAFWRDAAEHPKATES